MKIQIKEVVDWT